MTKPPETLVCASCSETIQRADVKDGCCPRCGGPVEIEQDQNIADKSSADSFPASDPPSY